MNCENKWCGKTIPNSLADDFSEEERRDGKEIGCPECGRLQPVRVNANGELESTLAWLRREPMPERIPWDFYRACNWLARLVRVRHWDLHSVLYTLFRVGRLFGAA